jgi:hypothetical protein
LPYSWINLDDGKFSFGNGALVWDGTTLTVEGTGDFTAGFIAAVIDENYIKSNTKAAGYTCIKTVLYTLKITRPKKRRSRVYTVRRRKCHLQRCYCKRYCLRNRWRIFRSSQRVIRLFHRVNIRRRWEHRRLEYI